MKIIGIAYLLLLLDMTQSNVIKSFTSQLLNEVQPSHVTLNSDFKGGQIINHCSYQPIFQYLINQIPTATIDLNRPPRLLKFVWKEAGYHRNITSPLHLIVLSEDKKDKLLLKLEIALKLIQQSLFYLSETKIVLVINRYKNSPDLINKIFSIIKSSNLINSVILQCAKGQSLSIIRHNFFHNTTVVENYKSNNAIVKYFPNKFDKIRGYIMRIGVRVVYWPKIYKNYTINYKSEQDDYENIMLFNSYEYFVHSLNVTGQIIPTKNDDTAAIILRKNKLDTFILRTFARMYGTISEYFVVAPAKFVLMVPIIEEKSITFFKDLIYFFFSLSGFIILFTIVAQCLNFSREEWSLLNIYSFCLGFAVNINFERSLKTKIIFFTLVVTSLFLINEFASDLMSIKYATNEIAVVETFDDIFEKNITFFFPGKRMLINDFKPALSEKALKLADITICDVRSMTPALNKGLVIRFEDANKILTKNKFVLNKIKHEISELIFLEGVSVIGFGAYSPFRTKFAKIYMRISEIGLHVKWRSDYDNVNKIDRRIDANYEDDEDALPIILFYIMIMGTIFSLIALFLELLWFYYLSKRDLIKKLKSTFEMIKQTPKKKISVRRIKVQPRKINVVSTV